MFGIRWSGFQGRLFGLCAVAVVGQLVTAGVLQTALNAVKVTGPLYDQIIRGQDLGNDLTPPVLNVRTPYILVLRMASEPDPARVRGLVAEFRQAEAEYLKRYAYWDDRLPAGPLKDALRDDVHAVSVEFFGVANRELLPAVEQGQKDKAAAARARLDPLYDRQKSGAGRIQSLADAGKAAAEADARAAVGFWGALSLGVAAAAVLAVAAAGWGIGRAIVRPARELAAAMKGMASGAGDLTARVQVRSDDEIGDLGRAINQVFEKLHDLVVSVRESSLQLYTSSTEIAATAREQESTMHTLGASTAQIAVAVKQITATTAELSGTMTGINDGGKQTGKLARAGRAGLTSMGQTMTRLADSTDSISGKLSAVRERANDITAVVTTITKVADQTNLLSINAAIEAEKAGESGRGFLVVAREIRRLADQTAVATLDIENMVRQMQGAVSAGVMEMDKFTDEVRTGVGKVGEINSQMGQIIEQVHSLNDTFGGVTEAMGQQSGGVRQINDAMGTLATGVQQTSASLREFHAVTVNLREAADTLRTQVAKFKVAG